MTIENAEASKPPEDTIVAWARRKENIRGTLKLFRVLLDAVKRHAEWVETRHGIGGAELWVLWELGQTPGMRAVDLAKGMAILRQTAESLLQGLLERGLVKLEMPPEAQSPIYFLTFDGQRITDASPEFGQGVLKSALERLPDSVLDQVVFAMKAVTENLPFREEGAALKPLSHIVRPNSL